MMPTCVTGDNRFLYIGFCPGRGVLIRLHVTMITGRVRVLCDQCSRSVLVKSLLSTLCFCTFKFNFYYENAVIKYFPVHVRYSIFIDVTSKMKYVSKK